MDESDYNKAINLVMSGYDKITDRYTTERKKFDNWDEVKSFCSKLPKSGRVLDAGCGTGIPIAQYLVKSGFNVNGIDISSGMMATAQRNVPDGHFRKMDMTKLEYDPGSFDGVISTYAVIHIPRETHAEIFKSFYNVLKSGGWMLVSVASWAWEEYAEYLGEKMFWSHYDSKTNERLIAEAGFVIEFGRTIQSGGETHHWILARKP